MAALDFRKGSDDAGNRTVAYESLPGACIGNGVVSTGGVEYSVSSATAFVSTTSMDKLHPTGMSSSCVQNRIDRESPAPKPLDSSTIVLAVRAQIDTKRVELADARFTEHAKSLLRTQGWPGFHAHYGEWFVDDIVFGATFSCMGEVVYTSKEMAMQAAIGLQVGGLNALASEAKSGTSVVYNVVQWQGFPAGLQPPTMQEADEFARSIGRHVGEPAPVRVRLCRFDEMSELRCVGRGELGPLHDDRHVAVLLSDRRRQYRELLRTMDSGVGQPATPVIAPAHKGGEHKMNMASLQALREEVLHADLQIEAALASPVANLANIYKTTPHWAELRRRWRELVEGIPPTAVSPARAK